jgi:tetratricopeptide (TPR) repeat protein
MNAVRLVLLCVSLGSSAVLSNAFAQASAPVPTSEGELCSAVSRSNASAAVKAVAHERSNGNTAAGLFMQGCLELANNRADRAADNFEKATGKDPAKSLYFDWLGRAYGDQAQKANKLKQPFLAKKTKAAFERAVQLDANNLDARGYLVDYYQLAPGFMGGSESKATEQIEAIRSRNPYRGGFVAANALGRRKDPAGVEREFATLVRTFPDSLQPRYALTNTLITQAKWGDAIRTLDAAVARFPDTRSLEYMAGRIAALSGQIMERGEASLRRYLTGTPGQNEPSLAAAHMRLGQILARKGATADAKAELQTAIKLDPNLREAKETLAKLK